MSFNRWLQNALEYVFSEGKKESTGTCDMRSTSANMRVPLLVSQLLLGTAPELASAKVFAAVLVLNLDSS